MKGKLYGVSVGPGDPELLTLKALRVLKEADIIAAPNVGKGNQTALGIVGEYIEGKDILDCSTPMSRDRELTAKAYDEIADDICRMLDAGKTVAFITLGDAGVYSTYYYVHERVACRGYETCVVPGVTSFSAAAARLGTPLCEASEQLHIFPASSADPAEVFALSGTKVFMKSGKAFGELRQKLSEHGLLDDASMVSRCGLEGEEVFEHVEDADEKNGYLSVVIVKDGRHE